MNRSRPGHWGACLAGLVALALGASELTASVDGALREFLLAARDTPGTTGARPLAALPGATAWGAMLAALLCLPLPRLPARRSGAALRGLLLALLPLLLAAALLLAMQRWLPPLSTMVAVGLAVLLQLAWRARDIHRVAGARGLRRAAARALADPDVLPCSLLRLQLHGGGRALPWPEILPVLQARARRGGDRLARCGRGEAALWLVSTDASAADGIAEELRADLAKVLARHGLQCRIGRATRQAAGGDAQALWDAARPE